jgi:hypothetical protein
MRRIGRLPTPRRCEREVQESEKDLVELLRCTRMTNVMKGSVIGIAIFIQQHIDRTHARPRYEMPPMPYRVGHRMAAMC